MLGKLALVVLAMTLITGCTGSTGTPVQQVGCAVETTVESAMSLSIASSLSCTNTAQIQADLAKALGSANLCQAATVQTQLKSATAPTSKAIVGNIVCPIAVQSVLALAASQIPATWGCSPQASVTTLSTVLTAACVAAVPI